MKQEPFDNIISDEITNLCDRYKLELTYREQSYWVYRPMTEEEWKIDNVSDFHSIIRAIEILESFKEGVTP